MGSGLSQFDEATSLEISRSLAEQYQYCTKLGMTDDQMRACLFEDYHKTVLRLCPNHVMPDELLNKGMEKGKAQVQQLLL
jgi:Uri superfamily endonuclease